MPTTNETIANQNTNSAFIQNGAVVAALSGGGYVVAWSDTRNIRYLPDGITPDPTSTGNLEIWARRYDANGNAVGGEFLLAGNTFDYSYYNQTGIAGLPANGAVGLPAGGFVVAMSRASAVDANSVDVVGKIFTTAGVQVGSEFAISTPAINDQQIPSISTFADGSFVVVFMDVLGGPGSGEIIAQRYNALHQPVAQNGTTVVAPGAGNFTVNVTTAGTQQFADVVALANGDFLVTWQADTQEGGQSGVYARLYNADGSTQTVGGQTEWLINETPADDQFLVSVAALTGGGFVATWTSDSQAGPGSTNDVYYRVFDANGAEVVTETLVNNTIAGGQNNSNVEALPDGGFLITWGENGDIRAQRFDANGNERGTEFAVTSTAGGQNQFTNFDHDPQDVLAFTQGVNTPSVAFVWSGAGAGDNTGVFTRQIQMQSAPNGTDATDTINEDTNYTFTVADFGFSDSVFDTPANSFLAVRVTTLPTRGTLMYDADGGSPSNATAVTVGQSVSVSDITAGRFFYVPAADGNTIGGPYTTFTFQVQDNGGSTNGSVDLDETPNTYTINVTPVNDAPNVINGTTETLAAVNEDTVSPTGATVSSLFASHFSDADDNQTATGGSSANTFAGVALVGNAATAAQGTWQYGDGVSWTTLGALADNNAITVLPTTLLRFVPAANFNGPAPALTVRLIDSSYSVNDGQLRDLTGSIGDPGAFSNATLTLNQTINSVNDAPDGADATLSVPENTPHNFTAADFGFTDAVDAAGPSGANALLEVIVTTLPTDGALLLSGVPVTAGQAIAAASIPNLQFVPDPNESGPNYATMTFQVRDNGGTANTGVDTDPVANTLTFNVLPLPKVSVNDPSVTEGNAGTTTLTFTVTLDAASLQTVTVNYATADGTALAGSDYTAASGLLTFAPGVTSQTVNVTVNGDTVFEANQTLFLNLSAPTNAAITDNQGVGTITNDDNAPTLTINDPSVSEGGGTATFTVTRTGATETAITVEYATADGTAVSTAGGPGTPDYTATNGTLTFNPSLAATATQTFTVAIGNDGIYEAVEQLAANLSNPVGATIADVQGLLTITDDDAAPTISVDDVTVGENGTATFTVTLTGATALPISVNYATMDGTAVSTGSAAPGTPDYTAATGTLTFNPSASGTQTLTVNVTLNDDGTNEPTEQFALNLSGPTNGATINDSQGVATVTDGDAVPSMSVGDVVVAEGDAGTTMMTFTVSLSAASGQTVTVNYASADGTALAGSDYAAASGTLTFAPGVTTRTVTVLVNGDTVFEPDQTLSVNLSGPTNATIADSQGVGTITNDDAAPTLSINDVSVSEAAGTATFTVTRTGATETGVTVDYATADDTALSVAGGAGTPDYTATSGALTFAPSLAATETQTFIVAIGDDGVYEGVEQAFANLSNATGATIADGQGVLTITDNEPFPSLSVGDITVSEDGTATFTVTLTGATALPISVDYLTADGTAVSAGSAAPGTPDYTTTTGTLTFPASAAGTQTLIVTVPLNDDATNEATEQFVVNLSDPSNGATIADGQGVATVTDNDPVPSLSIDDITVAEGDAGTTAFTFTVTLSAASAQTATVDFATVDGTALAGSDYAAISGTLTFAPGVTTQTVTVLVNGDTVLEPDEAFTVALSNATNATIADNSGTGTIDNDDNDPPTADNVGPVAGTEDQPARIAITLSGNDTDVGDAVTQFVLQSLPAGGEVFATDTGGTALTAGATIPATGTGPYTATIWFQPDPDFNGTDSFTYQADDGTDLSLPATVSLDIAAVNDAPSFDIAGNQNVAEDAGAITVAGFASNFQPGPADEAGQTLVGYTVTTDNPSLFAVGPAIDAVTGDLTYTLADDANGVANVTVVATDSGPSGGADVNQATRNFAINVAAVPDAPVVAAPIADQFGNVDIAFAFALPAGTFTDADGDTLTLTATLADGSSLPAGLTFDPATGTFSGEFATEQAFDIRVTASDGTSTVSDDFRLSIRAMPEPTDRPPLLIASSRAATVPENTTATGILLTPSDDNPGTFFEVGDFTLAGADAQRFAIVQTAAGFELVFKEAPDFEKPADAGGNNVYDVSVWVRNAGQDSAAVSLGVTVSDVVEGTNGTPGDDDLNGTPDDDVFYPLGGDDDVSGGAGNDTVVLPGVAAGYVFVQLISGDIGVIDIDPSDGDQGSDVLDSIEFVRFADGINVDAESLISREQAPWMLDTSDVEIVAATWQLLMGLVPTEAGFQYLINSPDNPTDLNDAYFMSFNMENKYQSFLSNLATETAGSKEWFDREFGGLTYQQAVEKAFDTIITAAALVEAGGDPTASKAFFLGAESYFNAVAAERIVRPGVDLAEGTKIALLSSVLYEAVKAGIGPYAEQVDEFATDLARVGYSTEFHSNLFETA